MSSTNPTTIDRRSFIRINSFAIASAALMHSCKVPVRYAIPYLVQPDDVIPGTPAYYATGYYDGDQFGSLLAKVIDGRPIKMEGNDICPFAKGSTSARMQASLLSLYNPDRLQQPVIEKKEVTWDDLDAKIIAALEAFKSTDKPLVILTRTLLSPTEAEVLSLFQSRFPSCEILSYDEISHFAIPLSHLHCFGIQKIPTYHFERADCIIGFNADFLGSWISPVENTVAYSGSRNAATDQKQIHIQFESHPTITGSRADQRIPINPSEEISLLTGIYNELVLQTGSHMPLVHDASSSVKAREMSALLLQYPGKSLILSGSNAVENQLLINAINFMLGNYSSTLDLQHPLQSKAGNDLDLERFIDLLQKPEQLGVIFYRTDPAYDLGGDLGARIEKLALSVLISDITNDTVPHVQYVCPAHHGLESWCDFETRKGVFHFSQPLLQPLFNTRHGIENFLTWSGRSEPYADFLRSSWKIKMKSHGIEEKVFMSFWDQCLKKGVYVTDDREEAQPPAFREQALVEILFRAGSPGLELEIYQKTNISTSDTTNNMWLQELPDPITRVSWDNYALIAPSLAEANGIAEGDILCLNDRVRISVVIQPGQASHTISVAWGYGRKNSGRIAEGTAGSMAHFVTFANGVRSYHVEQIKITKTEGKAGLARIQQHHGMEGRDLTGSGQGTTHFPSSISTESLETASGFYEKPNYPLHRWVMVIDLAKCTGCNACVVACQAENNIPVIGPDELSRRHEMYWIRIDRYYSGAPDNPRIEFMPVMCQHCSYAPCEKVCPTSATTHSNQGINQMIYNRCIGTRFCSNNCPYKARVFNWYDYTGADSYAGNEKHFNHAFDSLYRMVLNPGVTVRSKGVMEKCSFCIQRIEEKIIEARNNQRELEDGEIKPACMQTCPAGAIAFGDLDNPASSIHHWINSGRSYHLLEELNTQPGIYYLRNKA